MACSNCSRGNCTFHQSNGEIMKHFSTKVGYSVLYNVIDLRTGNRTTVKMSESERGHAKVIEIHEATATCSVCFQFTTCTQFKWVKYKNENINLVFCANHLPADNVIVDQMRSSIYEIYEKQIKE